MVTASPRARAAEAISEPMKPAPTMATCCGRVSSAARSARASSRVRRVWTPPRCSEPGSERADAPVAMISTS